MRSDTGETEEMGDTNAQARLEAVARHYREFLGEHYRWTVAGAGEPEARARLWLDARALLGARRVLDLGAGFGAHTSPLAQAGAEVTAVDLDAGLLEQLREGLGDAEDRVTAVPAELVAWLEAETGSTSEGFDLVLCVGDTLTHLPDAAHVGRLLRGVGRRLTGDGVLVLAWRDNSGPLPQGTARFLPVARERSRSMHCFLEEVDADRVRVTDVLTEVADEGPRTRFSDYHKLRLGADRVRALAEAAGLELVASHLESGMTEHHYRRAGGSRRAG